MLLGNTSARTTLYTRLQGLNTVRYVSYINLPAPLF